MISTGEGMLFLTSKRRTLGNWELGLDARS